MRRCQPAKGECGNIGNMYNPRYIRFTERDGFIKLPEIVNTIEVSGEVFRFEDLPENKKQEIVHTDPGQDSWQLQVYKKKDRLRAAGVDRLR